MTEADGFPRSVKISQVEVQVLQSAYGILGRLGQTTAPKNAWHGTVDLAQHNLGLVLTRFAVGEWLPDR